MLLRQTELVLLQAEAPNDTRTLELGRAGNVANSYTNGASLGF